MRIVMATFLTALRNAVVIAVLAWLGFSDVARDEDKSNNSPSESYIGSLIR